jgi:hypothetical protein
MTTELLFEIAWKSGLTLGLTLILLALLRRRSAAERSWIAHAGLAATLLMPLAILTATGRRSMRPPGRTRRLRPGRIAPARGRRCSPMRFRQGFS